MALQRLVPAYLCSFVLFTCLWQIGSADEKQTNGLNLQGDLCLVEGNIVGTIKEISDDDVTIEVVVRREHETGIPMLGKLPYVNRLFKNVGVATQTTLITLPRSQVKSITECGEQDCVTLDFSGIASKDTPCQLLGTQVCREEVEFLPISTVKACAANGDCCKKSTCAQACGDCKESTCAQARATKCPVNVVSRGKAQGPCEDCQCCSSCGCNKPANVHNVALHEKLVQALTENAELKAREEVRAELEEFKAHHLEALIESQVEVARLQARLEFAEDRTELIEEFAESQIEKVKLQATLQLLQNPQLVAKHVGRAKSKVQPSCSVDQCSVVSALQKEKAENKALKARIAELERRVHELAQQRRPNATR